jgi:hypothetical protein
MTVLYSSDHAVRLYVPKKHLRATRPATTSVCWIAVRTRGFNCLEELVYSDTWQQVTWLVAAWLVALRRCQELAFYKPSSQPATTQYHTRSSLLATLLQH